jgi:hypothetical protein
MPKHVGVENMERINKNIHYFLEHLLVSLQKKRLVVMSVDDMNAIFYFYHISGCLFLVASVG